MNGKNSEQLVGSSTLVEQFAQLFTSKGIQLLDLDAPVMLEALKVEWRGNQLGDAPQPMQIFLQTSRWNAKAVRSADPSMDKSEPPAKNSTASKKGSPALVRQEDVIGPFAFSIISWVPKDGPPPADIPQMIAKLTGQQLPPENTRLYPYLTELNSRGQAAVNLQDSEESGKTVRFTVSIPDISGLELVGQINSTGIYVDAELPMKAVEEWLQKQIPKSPVAQQS